MADISLSSIRRIMKKAGIDRASKEAVEALRDIAEKYVLEISKLALQLAGHAKRKTVSKEDILMAVKIQHRK